MSQRSLQETKSKKKGAKAPIPQCFGWPKIWEVTGFSSLTYSQNRLLLQGSSSKLWPETWGLLLIPHLHSQAKKGTCWELNWQEFTIQLRLCRRVFLRSMKRQELWRMLRSSQIFQETSQKVSKTGCISIHLFWRQEDALTQNLLELRRTNWRNIWMASTKRISLKISLELS